MKIFIIKLGALGDVVRTLPLLPAIKEKYKDAEIDWVTKPNAVQVFEGNPFVKKVFTIPFKTQESPLRRALLTQKYDILFNFDIEDEATALANEINAEVKYGFYSDTGYPATFNIGAEYYLNTLFDDELKKTNEMTYQEMMFKSAEIEYKKQHCPIYLSDKDKRYAEEFIKKNKINTDKLIGVHIGGGGARWPSKAWSEYKIKEFIERIKGKGYEVILFGGPDEIEKHSKLIDELKNKGILVYYNNPHNSVKEFAALINICQKIICSDTFALHIALALKKPTAGLFFCTSPHEVEDYGLLRKIISPLLYNFFPEKQDQYSEELVNSISVEDVLNALRN
ncbi:glycosyltransferase family 9 protein [Candidatus Pacearchaeota archaeon]|nr:glycosyltransferase family 9 protein [Candidatus Pacearchaeota archaeon]